MIRDGHYGIGDKEVTEEEFMAYKENLHRVTCDEVSIEFLASVVGKALAERDLNFPEGTILLHIVIDHVENRVRLIWNHPSFPINPEGAVIPRR